jgi:hypothetical protein
MAHFADLETTTQIATGPHVRAIGWLSSGQSYPTGAVPESFVARLRSLCARWSDSNQALHWPVFAGPHTCELCNEFRASGNVGIPAAGVLYVAPEMVSHYVERHGYLPPQEFIDAVLTTPTPGTPEFTRAVNPFVAGSAG